ncbi:MAG: hypothetical protein WC683_06755 [bacterium]
MNTIGVTALCMTHGRFTRLRDSLACFLGQLPVDAYRSALPVEMKMNIFNFAETPIHCEQPGVSVFNHPMSGGVHAIWAEALKTVDTEFVVMWLDDDLYLPWCLSQCAEHIGVASAIKTRQFWIMVGCNGAYRFGLHQIETGEGSYMVRTEIALAVGLRPADGAWIVPGLEVLDMTPGWVFRINDGGYHSENQPWTDQQKHDLDWRAHNADFGDGKTPLTPASLKPYWSALLAVRPDLAPSFRHD